MLISRGTYLFPMVKEDEHEYLTFAEYWVYIKSYDKG